MSRSFKKFPSDKCGEYVTKSEANRKFRRVNKQRINDEKEPLLESESTNIWEITDYKFVDFENEEKYKKLKRK